MELCSPSENLSPKIPEQFSTPLVLGSMPIALSSTADKSQTPNPVTEKPHDDPQNHVPSAVPFDPGVLFVAQVTAPLVPRDTHNAIGDPLIALSSPPEDCRPQKKERVPYDEAQHKYALIQEIIIRGTLSKACTALGVDYAGAWRDMKRDEGGLYDWDLIADEYRKQYLAADSRIFMRRIRKAVDQTMHHVDRVLGAQEYDFKGGVWSEVERMVKTVRLLQDKSTENVDLRAALVSAVNEFKSKSDEERAAILNDLRRGVPVA